MKFNFTNILGPGLLSIGPSLVLAEPLLRPVRAESKACGMVMEALKAADKLKPGIMRLEVENEFELDGGLAFQGQGRFTYRRCHYIKIDVEFEKTQESGAPTVVFSPGDRVTKISRPYLAYPVSD